MAFKLETIKKRKEFQDASKCRNGILGDFFILQPVKKDNQAGLRFGFTVTKKISKKAVVRNRIKRQLREVVRNFSWDIDGYDIFLIARYKMIDARYKDIESALKKQVKKIEK